MAIFGTFHKRKKVGHSKFKSNTDTNRSETMKKIFDTIHSHLPRACFCRPPTSPQSSKLFQDCSSFFCPVSRKKIVFSTAENINKMDVSDIADIPFVLSSCETKYSQSMLMLMSGNSILSNFIFRSSLRPPIKN